MAGKRITKVETAESTNPIETIEETIITEDKTKETIKIKKEFKPTDSITCISCTAGELIMVGKKTGTRYTWSDYGDISEVEYQDLNSAKLSKSAFVFSPLFIIDDEDLLENEKWADVKALYEKMYSRNLNDLFELNSTSLRKVLSSLPKGLKTSFKNIAATKIEEGSLDSVSLIKTIDSVLGTDLLTCLVK